MMSVFVRVNNVIVGMLQFFFLLDCDRNVKFYFHLIFYYVKENMRENHMVEKGV